MERHNLKRIVENWLESCKRKGKISRNTIAVGIVVLDRLRDKAPVTHEEMFSETGGEVRGARSGLNATLKKYKIPDSYLKEATTRQASHDAERLLGELEYGDTLVGLSPDSRDEILTEGIEVLCREARGWLARQNLKISCNHSHAPSNWIGSILKEAQGKSGGRVEQHLIGAKLQKRHPEISIPNYAGSAGDVQTGRKADFDIGSVSYHVTAAPGVDVIRKCKANADSNRHPVLLVPRDQVERTRAIAQVEKVDDRLEIQALEDFIANNIIEISIERQTDLLSTLKDIIKEYNRRVADVETDLALKIEIQ
ncbi:MAG: DUF4928 family protein [Terriglobia bacterium]